MIDVMEEMGSGLAYGLVGLVLLAVGYRVIDMLTPGDIGRAIYTDRNSNAALVVSSGLIAIGAIVTTAIVTSHDDFTRGIVSAIGYGALGVFLLALSFVVVDRLTPGKLGVICMDDALHPAVFVTMASQLALGAIVSAAIG